MAKGRLSPVQESKYSDLLWNYLNSPFFLVGLIYKTDTNLFDPIEKSNY